MTSVTQLDDIKNAMRTRIALYSFLSRAFRKEVDDQFLQMIRAMSDTIRILASQQEEEEFSQASSELAKFSRQVEEASGKARDDLLIDLAAEYAGLFLNAGPKPVFLVESVYLTQDHLLYGKPYFAVLDAYRVLGFDKVKDFKEPEDHVAVELEFMAHLCNFALRALEEANLEYAKGYLKNQEEFLTDHLSKWVPELAHGLKETSSTTFYRAMAYLLNGFIRMEKELFPHLIDEVESLKSSGVS